MLLRSVLRAAAVAQPWLPADLRRFVLPRSLRRTFVCRLGVDRLGFLRWHGLRLHLHGLSPPDDPQAMQAFMAGLQAHEPSRLRLLRVERDGSLIVCLRCGGRSAARLLLRRGIVAIDGRASRSHRRLQAAAQAERLGLWRGSEVWPIAGSARRATRILDFMWWQG